MPRGPAGPVLRSTAQRGGGGFTLIEINLAVLLIATGVLIMLALFPLGLKHTEQGIADTHEAMFATYVLSGLEANALAMTDFNDWSRDLFPTKVDDHIDDVGDRNWRGDPAPTITLNPWPDGGTRMIRYQLTVELEGAEAPHPVYRATLWVKSGKYGTLTDGHYYTTKFVYMGM